MDFLNICFQIYKSKIEYFENKVINETDIYKVKQYIKVLDDLCAEDYFELSKKIEKDIKGITRLKKILNKHHENSFKITNKSIPSYNRNNYEKLDVFLNTLIEKSYKITKLSNNKILPDILNFSKSIENKKNTAYVFLLRDALLPYIYFKESTKAKIYPFLIGRKFLEFISNKKNIDDIIRNSILSNYLICNNDFTYFKKLVKNDILDKLKDSSIISTIKELLNTINEKEIIVIESGCYGTIPMLLSVIDERVDFKMFTAVPFLQDLYKDRLYTLEYEKNRDFESLYSQNELFDFNYFDKSFSINYTLNKEIELNSLKEINFILKNL